MEMKKIASVLLQKVSNVYTFYWYPCVVIMYMIYIFQFDWVRNFDRVICFVLFFVLRKSKPFENNRNNRTCVLCIELSDISSIINNRLNCKIISETINGLKHSHFFVYYVYNFKDTAIECKALHWKPIGFSFALN